MGARPRGKSPFGLLDGAGQVSEWTATKSGPGRYIVKGGSWDDKGCGICRPAASHARGLARSELAQNGPDALEWGWVGREGWKGAPDDPEFNWPKSDKLLPQSCRFFSDRYGHKFGGEVRWSRRARRSGFFSRECENEL